MDIDREEWLYLRGQVNGLTVALADKTRQIDQLEHVIIAQLDKLTGKIIDLLDEQPRPPRQPRGGRPDLTIVRSQT
jgi:hypothetical protein